MTTRHEEGPLAREVSSGPALYSGFTAPDGAPKAVVALLHGYADYGGRYAHVVEAWAELGIATVTIDMRGHGRAKGRRGYCERFTEYLDDVAELVEAGRQAGARGTGGAVRPQLRGPRRGVVGDSSGPPRGARSC